MPPIIEKEIDLWLVASRHFPYSEQKEHYRAALLRAYEEGEKETWQRVITKMQAYDAGRSSVWQEVKEKCEGMKVKVEHATECLATSHSESYCDCSDYAATLAKNWALQEVISYAEEQLKEITK